MAVSLSLIAGVIVLVTGLTSTVRRQSQAADLEQSLRIGSHEIARRIRAAGRGGLAMGAVEVRDNVPLGYRMGARRAATVVADTDVLIVRGVFDAPLYEIAAWTAETPDFGSVHLLRVTSAGAAQELASWLALANEEPDAALLIAGPVGSARCSWVEMTGCEIVSESRPGVAEEIRLTYRSLDSDAAALGATLCPSAPSVEDATRIGALREYRYYVRHDVGSAAAVPVHRLTRGRFRPGTEIVHPSSPATGEDLLDHTLDLQVALGFDLDRDGLAREAADRRSAAADEWLGNESSDDRDDPRWGAAPGWVRFTILLRSAGSEPRYLSPALDRIENRLYRELGTPAADAVLRRYQRAHSKTLVRRRP